MGPQPIDRGCATASAGMEIEMPGVSSSELDTRADPGPGGIEPSGGRRGGLWSGSTISGSTRRLKRTKARSFPLEKKTGSGKEHDGKVNQPYEIVNSRGTYLYLSHIGDSFHVG